MFPFESMLYAARMIAQLLPLTHFLRLVRGIVLKGSSFAMATFALAGPPQIIRKRIGGLVPMALAPSGAALSKQLLEVLLHGISKKA